MMYLPKCVRNNPKMQDYDCLYQAFANRTGLRAAAV